MNLHLFVFTILFLSGTATCKSIHREERDITSGALPLAQLPLANRQTSLMGFTALGTLVPPLLFLMGMNSFVSMLPQMFQNVMRGVGPNFFQLLRPNLAITGGGSSSSSLRAKRYAEAQPTLVSDELLDELEKMWKSAVMDHGAVGIQR